MTRLERVGRKGRQCLPALFPVLRQNFRQFDAYHHSGERVMRTAIQSQYITISRVFAFLAVGASLLVASPRAHAADAAETFVQNRIEAGFGILRDSQLAAEPRHRQFRDFLLSMIDMRRVALFTIGTYARDAKEPDLARFVSAYTEFSVNFYERALDHYAGQAIRLTGSSRRSEDDAVVTADAVDPKGAAPPLKVAFRVRKNERGEPVITDFQVEGAWLALMQRSEFMSFLQQHRGEIAQLSHELEKRTRWTDAAGSPKEPQS
jgi:ABC-type transporter MlaC component